jgi:hypothetical protein
VPPPTASRALEPLNDSTDLGVKEGNEERFQFVLGILDALIPEFFFQGFSDIETVPARILDVHLGVRA